MSRRIVIAIFGALAVLAATGFGAYRLGLRAGAHDTPPAVDKSGRKVLYWHDPMVPGQKFDKPGKSPFMDMELVPVYADEGQPHTKRNQHAELPPVMWCALEQGQQLGLGHVEQAHRAFGQRVVCAGQSIEQRDLAEPAGRIDEREDGLLARLGHARHAQRAFKHGVEPIGRIATEEQVLTMLQAARHGQGQQILFERRRDAAKPWVSAQQRQKLGRDPFAHTAVLFVHIHRRRRVRRARKA